MRILKTTAAVLFLVAALMAVFDGRVHSQNSPPRGPADQANFAATRNANWTPGSVDLEGVSANDRTTYTFKTNVNPPAAGGPANIAPGTSTSMSTSPNSQESSAFVVPADDPGGGGTDICKQPVVADAPANFDDKTNGFILDRKSVV